MAIASLLLAIASLLISLTHCYVFGIITAVASVVLGIISISKKKGRVLGIIGIIISVLSSVIIVLTLL